MCLVKVAFFFAICSCFKNITADIEGSQCMSNENNGTCVFASRCESLLLGNKNPSFPKVCGFKGKEPIVCCVDCELVDDINNIYHTTTYGKLVKTTQRSWNACIDNVLKIEWYRKNCNRRLGDASFSVSSVFNPDRKCFGIYEAGVSPAGGEDAKRAEFPFMALLGYGSSIEEAQWLCGGSVLSERYILTAAHCIAEPRLGPLKYAALGILKRSDPPEYWQHHSLAEVIPHPDYVSPSKYHDIALLKTEKQIEFSINVFPVCLLSGKQNKYRNLKKAWALGWGYLGPRQRLADVLQKVELKQFTTEECEEQYPPHRHMLDGFDNNTQVCYGDKETVHDTCEGDSGGPLIMDGNEIYCTRALFGVTSSGVACGEAGAGLYTRVEYYKPWIESIVWT